MLNDVGREVTKVGAKGLKVRLGGLNGMHVSLNQGIMGQQLGLKVKGIVVQHISEGNETVATFMVKGWMNGGIR